MLTVTDPLETAQDFIAYLNAIYGTTISSQKTVADVNKIWSEWKRQGISKPVNIEEITCSSYDTFRFYFDDIMQLCESSDIDAKTVFFVLIRIKSLNALANTMTNADKVIIFDDNLIAFFTAFIITSLQVVYSDPSEQETEELESFLFSILNTFYGKEQTEEEDEAYLEQFMKIIQKDYQLTEIGSYFSMAFTVFIICHELSHHILGHAGENKIYLVSKGKQKEKTYPIPINTPAHKEEFEADEYGYKLFLELIEKVDQVESAKLSQAFNRSPLIFFEIIEIVQLFRQTQGFYQQKSDTHPDPMQRKQQLLLRYGKQLAPDGEVLYNGFMGFADYIKKQLNSSL